MRPLWTSNYQASDNPQAARNVGQTRLHMRSIAHGDRCPRTARHVGVKAFDPCERALALSGRGIFGGGNLGTLASLGEKRRKGKIAAGSLAKNGRAPLLCFGQIGLLMPERPVPSCPRKPHTPE